MAAAMGTILVPSLGHLRSFHVPESRQVLLYGQVAHATNGGQMPVLPVALDRKQCVPESQQLATAVTAAAFQGADVVYASQSDSRAPWSPEGIFRIHVGRLRGAPCSVAGTAVQLGSSPEEEEPATAGDDGNSNGSSGGNSGDSGAGGSGGGAGDSAGEGEGERGDDYGPILGIEKVAKIVADEGIQLPQDMLDYAKVSGIPAVLLQRYIELQRGWLGPLARASGAFRNRMLADPAFLFKIGTEVTIDSCCATFAEVQRRGDEFWKEFDLYASDLLVGIALDVALVGMLAPAARFALAAPVPAGLKGRLGQGLRALPNSMFEAALPGQKFSAGQRAATWVVKASQYGVVGFGCGFVGQGIANSLIRVKRHFRKAEEGEEEVRLPSVVQTAALWGVFMAVSSNTRYQVINGLERVVESSIVAKRVPLLSSAFTVAIRFGNNVFGGMQFVDWARWSGVQ